MSLTQTPEETKASVAEGKAVSAQRIAAMKGETPTAKQEKPKAAEESAQVGKPVDDSAGKGSVTKEPVAKPGTPAEASKPAAVADYSFVPKDLVSEAEKLTPKFLAHLKDQAERDKNTTTDYHRKTTALKAEAAALESKKALTEFGESVHDDPEAMAALRALHAKRTGKPTPEGESKPFKFTEEHTDEEWEAYFAARDKRVEEAAIARIEGQRNSESKEVKERRSVSEIVISTLCGKGGEGRELADVEATFSALGDWKGVRALLDAKGEAFSAENVVATLRTLLPAKAEKPPPVEEPKQDSPNGSESNGHAANGASAFGRNSGVNAPLRVPKFMLDGKQPSDRNERLSAALFKVNEKRISEGKAPFTND